MCVLTAAYFQHQRSNQVVRKELQQHLQQHRQLMHGYTDYLQRHAAAMLALCLDPRRDGAGQPGLVSAAEVDRLSLLLTPGGEETQQRHDGDGSPMEISPTPFSGAPQHGAQCGRPCLRACRGTEWHRCDDVQLVVLGCEDDHVS